LKKSLGVETYLLGFVIQRRWIEVVTDSRDLK